MTNGRALYQLMTSGIIPRPIAFVSSISHDGVENLAPFRYAYSFPCKAVLNFYLVGLTW